MYFESVVDSPLCFFAVVDFSVVCFFVVGSFPFCAVVALAFVDDGFSTLIVTSLPFASVTVFPSESMGTFTTFPFLSVVSLYNTFSVTFFPFSSVTSLPFSSVTTTYSSPKILSLSSRFPTAAEPVDAVPFFFDINSLTMQKIPAPRNAITIISASTIIAVRCFSFGACVLFLFSKHNTPVKIFIVTIIYFKRSIVNRIHKF